MKETVSECPLESALLLLSGRWRVLILYWLSKGPMGFNTLRRVNHGISHQMLTRELRTLETSGLIRRTEFPTVPVQVEYALTDGGRRVIPLLKALGHWWEELRTSTSDSDEIGSRNAHLNTQEGVVRGA
jgi:DNA-binding HxlR family transcriptional regulator